MIRTGSRDKKGAPTSGLPPVFIPATHSRSRNQPTKWEPRGRRMQRSGIKDEQYTTVSHTQVPSSARKRALAQCEGVYKTHQATPPWRRTAANAIFSAAAGRNIFLFDSHVGQTGATDVDNDHKPCKHNTNRIGSTLGFSVKTRKTKAPTSRAHVIVLRFSERDEVVHKHGATRTPAFSGVRG